LNSPNDIVCASDDSLWFTDPSFGIIGQWEGEPAAQELPHAVYRLPPNGGPLQRVIDDLKAPNGLAFSPDEAELYVIESRSEPYRRLWAYRVGGEGQLTSKRLVIDAADGGALDGMAVDNEGNLWCGWGSTGRVPSEGLDGVRVFDAAGKALAHIHLPERCANVCFGGAKRNRLFMAASHSLYALYVNVQGAV
jgi:gluconolactonase